MALKKSYLILLIAQWPIFCLGQLTIKGTATDSVTKMPVEYLLTAIYHYKSDKIITYAYTDPQGNYTLVLPYAAGIFTFKTRSLEYADYVRDIVLGDAGPKEINISFEVVPKINALKEVVVKAKPTPVIVKKDTIIYDVAHYTQVGDQTLEDVLRKMPGFEVQENGELKINGKPIAKVLINGEEFLKGGAALSTRSISPDMVQSLEVRLDEKDTKIKESLLNSDKMVVLDIKLKDDFDKSLFGKVRITSGYQKALNMGGYANLFSLGKKQKYHILGEFDAFGQQTISLMQISNIGREAFQSIFNLPANFNSLAENPEFNKEVYGFKDFTQSKLGIAGVTAKYNLGKHLEMFVGSYNSYAKEGVGGRTTQRFFESPEFRFTDQKTNTNYLSKNKIDFEYDNEKIKANYNFNLVLTNKNLSAFNQSLADGLNFLLDRGNQSDELYNNFLFEYLVNKKIAFQAKSFFGVSNKSLSSNLNHNQPWYIRYMTDDNGQVVNNFYQTIDDKKNELAADAKLQMQGKLGSLQVGLQYYAEQRNINKAAFNNVAPEKIVITNSLFSGSTPTLNYTKWMPYAEHRISFGKVGFHNKLGLANLSFPGLNFSYQDQRLLEYDGGLKIDFNTEDNFSFSYSQKVSAYPLLNIAGGYDLIDFQTFSTPQLTAPKPQVETTLQMNFDKIISPINTATELFALYTQSKTYNSYAFNTEPFIGINANQLSGNYLVAGIKIATVFNRFPFNLKIEPSYLANENDNLTDQSTLYKTTVQRRMLQIRLLSSFEKKSYNLELKTKYSDFKFNSDITSATNQYMFLTGIVYKQTLFDKKLLLQTSLQRVDIWGGGTAVNLNLSARAQYNVKSIVAFIEGDNLLDNQYFIRQNILPTYFSESQQFLFARFFRAGVEYSFK
ncbi:MAG: TonB-dependent receptor [Chryseotalea sp. WA131a]|nr:MAG: TonB-dependent receptor [Chryseotalea sp. WA131a]